MVSGGPLLLDTSSGPAGPDYPNQLSERLEVTHAFARGTIGGTAELTRERERREPMTSTQMEHTSGDLVWVYKPRRTKGKSPKLQNAWMEPCAVLDWLGCLPRSGLHSGVGPRLVGTLQLSRPPDDPPPPSRRPQGLQLAVFSGPRYWFWSLIFGDMVTPIGPVFPPIEAASETQEAIFFRILTWSSSGSRSHEGGGGVQYNGVTGKMRSGTV